MTKKLGSITTPWTDIVLAQQGDPEMRTRCLELLAEKYREPIRQFIESAMGARRPEQADDLVQGYFVKFLNGDHLETLDESKGSLRGFFMTAVRRYVQTEIAKGKAGISYSAFTQHHGLPAGENIVDKSASTPDEEFNRTWARNRVSEAVEAFRLDCLDHGKKDYYDVFERHVLNSDAFGNPSYADTAKALGMTVKRVENCLYNAQKNFNKMLWAIIRTTVANDDLMEQELAELEKYLRQP